MKYPALISFLCLAFSLTNSNCSKKISTFNSQEAVAVAEPLNREELLEMADLAHNVSPATLEVFDEFYRSMTFDVYYQVLYSIVPREPVVIAGVEIDDFQEVVAANKEIFEVFNEEFENLGDFFDQVEQNPERWVEGDESGDVEFTPAVEPFNMEDLIANGDADLLEESYLALYETLQNADALNLRSPPRIGAALFLQGQKRTANDAGMSGQGNCKKTPNFKPGPKGNFEVTPYAWQHVCNHINGSGYNKPRHTLFANPAVAASSFQALESICKENSIKDGKIDKYGKPSYNSFLRIPGAGQSNGGKLNYVKVAYSERSDAKFNLITMYPISYNDKPANESPGREKCQGPFSSLAAE